MLALNVVVITQYPEKITIKLLQTIGLGAQQIIAIIKMIVCINSQIGIDAGLGYRGSGTRSQSQITEIPRKHSRPQGPQVGH